MKIETALKYNTKIYLSQIDAHEAAQKQLGENSNLVYLGTQSLEDAPGYVNAWNVWD